MKTMKLICKYSMQYSNFSHVFSKLWLTDVLWPVKFTTEGTEASISWYTWYSTYLHTSTARSHTGSSGVLFVLSMSQECFRLKGHFPLTAIEASLSTDVL
jgi:hypothetical protein